jgi:hypothetical protein
VYNAPGREHDERGIQSLLRVVFTQTVDDAIVSPVLVSDSPPLFYAEHVGVGMTTTTNILTFFTTTTAATLLSCCTLYFLPAITLITLEVLDGHRFGVVTH